MSNFDPDWTLNFTHPILSCSEAQALEKRLLGGDEGREWAAMNRAGRALGQEVMQDFREVGRFAESAKVLVLAGKGHNGGDAILAADEILRENEGVEVTLVFVPGDRNLRPLAKRSVDLLLRNWGGRVRILSWREKEGERLSQVRWDVCLDGILGMQFRPPLGEPVEQCVKWVNDCCDIRMRAAVDLPTGVGDESSRVRFQADFTYATGIVKGPLIEPENGESVGRIRYLDIGFFEEDSEANRTNRVLLSSAVQPLSDLRPSGSDKRSYGHLFLVGGSRMMPGAIQMAVRAAVKSGVGLVTAFVPESVVAQFAVANPEAMWVPMPETREGGLGMDGFGRIKLKIESSSALVVGPGMGRGEETRELIARTVSETAVRMAIDADGLQSEVIASLGGRPEGAGEVVLTPHLGEFRRIAKGEAETAMGGDLRRFSSRYKVTTILKGRVTRISDGEQIIHNFFGGPLLARGGSGDILVGLVGSMLARPGADGVTAACRAVALHGLAGDRLAQHRGAEAVRTTDLLEFLPEAIRES